MLGKDGRLYDPDFDYDHDGQLNSYEYSEYEDITFGHDDDEIDEEDYEIKELIDSGLDKDILFELDDVELFETLTDACLDPEDYEDYFNDYEEAKKKYSLKVSLDSEGLSEIDFKYMRDSDKYKLLLEQALDPDDYDDYFDDINEAERLYDLYEELEGAGLSKDVLQTEDSVLYATLKNAELDPEDYEEFFLDYKETEKKYIMTNVLGQYGIMPIDIYDVDDDTLYEALEKADINPFDYIEYFDDIYDASSRYDLFRELEDNDLDKSILEELEDSELYQVLLDAELDPSDYEEFFFDFEETEKLFANDQEYRGR